MTPFFFALVLMTALPLLIVGLFALSRRYPDGAPASRLWMPLAILAALFATLAIVRVVDGSLMRGLAHAASALAAGSLALIQRSKSRAE